MGVMAATLRVGGSEGEVNYVGDHGGYGRPTCFNEEGGRRIELAGSGFGFKDEFRG